MADLLAADCRRSRRRVDRDRRRGSSAAAGYGVETRRGCYHDGGRRQDRGTFAARFRRRSGWARPGAGRAARTRRGTGDRLRSGRKAAEDDRAAGIGGRNGCGDGRECRVAVAADCGSGRDVGRCGGAGFGGKRRACRGSRVRRGVGDRPEACVRRAGDKRRKSCGGQRRTDWRSCRPVRGSGRQPLCGPRRCASGIPVLRTEADVVLAVGGRRRLRGRRFGRADAAFSHDERCPGRHVLGDRQRSRNRAAEELRLRGEFVPPSSAAERRVHRREGVFPRAVARERAQLHAAAVGRAGDVRLGG